MIPQLESASYLTGYSLHLRFADGTEGDLDLTRELWGEVFEPLKDPQLFQGFRLDRELNTITWETGADLAPEFLYEQVRGKRYEARGDCGGGDCSDRGEDSGGRSVAEGSV
jgi:hypothetical protein